MLRPYLTLIDLVLFLQLIIAPPIPVLDVTRCVTDSSFVSALDASARKLEVGNVFHAVLYPRLVTSVVILFRLPVKL